MQGDSRIPNKRVDGDTGGKDESELLCLRCLGGGGHVTGHAPPFS